MTTYYLPACCCVQQDGAGGYEVAHTETDSRCRHRATGGMGGCADGRTKCNRIIGHGHTRIEAITKAREYLVRQQPGNRQENEMTTTMIYLTNDFHGTSVRLRVSGPGHVITASQARRISRALCPRHQCTCGQVLNTRGVQRWPDGTRMVLDYEDHGRVVLT